jgi:glycosyltransferase involved in cell wall biosynthesis
MRSVLLLAFHYPPIGGAGAQRKVQLVRRLPDLGYLPVIVTGPSAPKYRWTPPDESLGDEMRGVAVHRLPGPEPAQGVRWEGRFERWLRVPSRWQRWWSANAVRIGAEVGGSVELVHAALGPYTGAAAALAVARRLGRPLVVDLEDPWALDEMLVYPSRLHRRLELRRMGSVLSAADAVVMNTEEARRRVLEEFPELDPARVTAIPNAFDPLDFDGPVSPRDDGCFRIVHTGSLHTDLGLRQRSAGRGARLLGGSVPGVDLLSRSHVYLLEAVHATEAARHDLRGRIEVHLAGVFTDEDRAVAARYPFVRLHEFVPHAETISLMRSADMLFLPMQDLPPGRRATIVPHKTYEYLAAGRPILAAVPEGDARDLLREAGNARLCRPSDSEAMADIVAEEVDRWLRGAEPVPPRREVLRRCGASRLAAAVVGVYDEVLASRSSRSE